MTVDSDCSHKIKRCLVVGRIVMGNLNSILKSRDITLPTKLHGVKTGFSSRCESWTIRKVECQRSDAFKLWYWRRLLWFPLTAKRSNKSILKDYNLEYSLEELMLKPKLQYFGHLMWRANPLQKTLMLEKFKGKRRRGWQRMRWLDSIIVSMGMTLSKLREIVKETGKPGMLQLMESQRVRHNLVTEQQWLT